MRCRTKTTTSLKARPKASGAPLWHGYPTRPQTKLLTCTSCPISRPIAISDSRRSTCPDSFTTRKHHCERKQAQNQHTGIVEQKRAWRYRQCHCVALREKAASSKPRWGALPGRLRMGKDPRKQKKGTICATGWWSVLSVRAAENVPGTPKPFAEAMTDHETPGPERVHTKLAASPSCQNATTHECPLRAHTGMPLSAIATGVI